jgi:hypothetical protein
MRYMPPRTPPADAPDAPAGDTAGRAEKPPAPPSPPEPPSIGQTLAGALLPVLLHRIRNTTQLLAGVNALLAVDAARPLSPVRADDLLEASRQAEELGWLLGVLSGGLGAELAETRRVSGGLAATLELVRDALRRAGDELALPAGPLPELASPPRPASLCLAVAGLVWHAALGAERAELAIERAPDAWRLRLACSRPFRLAERDLLSRIPAARCTAEPSGWSLELPADWLAPGRVPAGPARSAGPAGIR